MSKNLLEIDVYTPKHSRELTSTPYQGCADHEDVTTVFDFMPGLFKRRALYSQTPDGLYGSASCSAQVRMLVCSSLVLSCSSSPWFVPRNHPRLQLHHCLPPVYVSIFCLGSIPSLFLSASLLMTAGFTSLILPFETCNRASLQSMVDGYKQRWIAQLRDAWGCCRHHTFLLCKACMSFWPSRTIM